MTRMVFVTHPFARPGSSVDPPAQTEDEPWADRLTGLVRSHQARLEAPDPSRPWLDRETTSPGRRDATVTPGGSWQGASNGR